MFSELIYTRCRQGIDITRKGSKISSDGYKVYSCTHAIMNEGAIDLQFLMNAAQAKQPYTDPDFMDDAYLFYVHEGKSFFVNFHPIPFDANAQGDYAHRPGNFVNHALLGDFSKIYPYKMFQDDSIWNAKTRGEAYYYENPPSDNGLPERGDIIDPPGKYKYEEIGAFIADGRKEALAKAVAFLIAQYNEEPEKRKFLIIKDDTSKNIELWIAAIECAFSPRIASVVPFATRMDKFVSANKYTVKMGVYQQQINLQDPNQKQRYRAMIVGLDERDKANVSALRPLPNSPFVLLDGKQKQLAFECNIQHGYYQLITKFDDAHKKFCGEFLQAFNVLKPSADILDLYEIFTVFEKPSLPGTSVLANILDRLNKYKAAEKPKDASAIKASPIYEIYRRVNTDVSRLLQEEFSLALNIINWMLSASEFVGDTGVKQRLTDIVCKEFTGIIFGKTDNTKKSSYWTQIQRTGFKMDVARVMTDMKVISDNSSKFKAFSSADVVTFITIYLDSFLQIGGIDQKDLKMVIKNGIVICCHYTDQKSLDEIISTLSRVKSINCQDLLLELVKGADVKLGEFVIKYIIDHDNTILASDKSALSFCEKLEEKGLEQMTGDVLIKRVDKLVKPSEMEQFIKIIHDKNFIKEEILAKVFESIDNKIGASKDNISHLVELLQTLKPNGAKCINSAHVFVLNILSGNFKKKSPIEVFKDLKSQGFPTITDEGYIDKFIEGLIKTNLPDEESEFILNFLFHAPKEYYCAYLKKVACAASKYKDKWNALINFISDGKKKQIDDEIVQALANSKQNEKTLMSLGSLLKEENSRIYYKSIADKAIEIISSPKDKSKDERK
ncbi:hypothetical protein R84B8_03205 [Treponema sp. R8-4-B8]